MAIVQFVLDPARAQLPKGFLIDRPSRLRTQRIGDLPCKFRTGYPVTLWPVQVAAARFTRPPFPAGVKPPRGAVAALRLQLECLGGLNFADLSLDRLRFYLSGESETVAHAVRADLQPCDPGRADGVGQCRRWGPRADLPRTPRLPAPGRLRARGRPASLSRQSFPGYRLLSEFFAFPSKFLLRRSHGACGRRAGPASQKRLEVVLFVNRGSEKLEQDVNAETFQLGCTPAINLFEQTAEPIALDQTRHEYRIVPDVANPERNGGLLGRPGHRRRPDLGTIHRVSAVLLVSARCTLEELADLLVRLAPAVAPADRSGNRGLPQSGRPRFRSPVAGRIDAGRADDLHQPGAAADSSAGRRTACVSSSRPPRPLARIRCLRSPSAPLRPPLRRGLYWRLVSHLCLNHLSISHGAEGRDALQEILRLYDFSDPGPGQAGRSGHSAPDRWDHVGDEPRGSRQAAGRRRQLLPRHRGHDRVRRGEVRRHRRLPVRLRATACVRTPRRRRRNYSSTPLRRLHPSRVSSTVSRSRSCVTPMTCSVAFSKSWRRDGISGLAWSRSTWWR